MTAGIMPNITADPFYEYFHEVGFSPMLLLFYLPTFLVSTISLTFNCALLYVTIRKRNLHKSFNILIALDSFASAMFEVAHISPFFIALFGINYIGSMPCFFLSIPSVFGSSTTLICMLFVGVERLCCLIFPIWTKQISAAMSKVLLLIGLVIINIYWIYNAVIVYQGIVNDMKNIEVRCSMGDYKPAWVAAISYRNNLALLGATIALYSILCLYVLRTMWKKTQISAYNWHIMKAVSVIMALLLTGWVLIGTSLYFLPLFNLNGVQRLVASSILTDWTILCSGSNGPVLYMFSADYRQAFRKEFKFLFSGQIPSSCIDNTKVEPMVHYSNHHRRMIKSSDPNPSPNIAIVN